MERYPAKLEENFEQLKLQMEALGRLKDPEFQILRYEYQELKRGVNTNNWNARLKLNSKVIKLFNDVTISQGRDKASSASVDTLRRKAATSNFSSKLEIDEGSSSSIEAFLRELAKEKPMRFSHQDLSRFTSDFSTMIGSGAFGEVYVGQFPGGAKVAVKKLLQNNMIEETFMAEVGTMGKASHRNLIRLYGFCFDVNMKALVYEFMENGSFDEILSKKGGDMDWEKLYGIAIGTARGLSYLHEGCNVQIIHHDVKPANVLLDSNFSPKITDFGLANLIDESKNHVTISVRRGTNGYIAPEMSEKYAHVTDKSDVYSFGMLLFDILEARRNNQKSQVGFPKLVWKMFEMGKLDKLIEYCGIEEKSRKNAETLATVALLCIQWTDTKRYRMSTVVKMLEKEVPVPVPQNPFIPAAEPSIPENDEGFY